MTSTLKRTITKSTLKWVAVLCALRRWFTPGAHATSTISPPLVWLIDANPPSEFICFSLIFFLYNRSTATTTTMTSDVPPAYQCQLAQHISSFSLCTPSSSIAMMTISPLSPSPSGSMPTCPASPQCHPTTANGPSPPAPWVAQQQQ